MVDVLHYFFEVEHMGKSRDDLNAVNALRDSMYEHLYGGEYARIFNSVRDRINDFSEVADGEFSNEPEEPMEKIQPFNPRTKTKGFIPPTPVSDNQYKPFGDVLDAPIG